MKSYFVTYIGEQPAELSEMTVYRPKLATGFVIVTTDKSVEELIGIKGVINVAKADTVNLLQAYKFCRKPSLTWFCDKCKRDVADGESEFWHAEGRCTEARSAIGTNE